MVISLCSVQSKYIKMHQQKSLSILGRNVLHFFWVLLYIDYLSNLHKKFKVASMHNTLADKRYTLTESEINL